MFYSEDIIEQVRTENDIVDVIGDYVKLQKKAVPILDSARFTMKNHLLFPCLPISRCITVSVAEKGETSFPF